MFHCIIRTVFLSSLECHSAKIFYCITRLECITLPIVSLSQNAPVYYPHSVLTLLRPSFRLNVLPYYSRKCIILPLVSFGQNVTFLEYYSPPCSVIRPKCSIVLSSWSVTAVSFDQNVPLCYPPTALLHPYSTIRPKVPLYFPYSVITLPTVLFGQKIY